jgi:outer membrane protein OmpA-like peptidoglycan-associated protein
MLRRSLLLAVFLSLPLSTFAQSDALQSATPQSNVVPIYRVTVVNRTVKAISYRHRSGSTKLDLRGTSILPEAQGSAEVQSKQGAIKVDAVFKHLQVASAFGPEYVTYVLWAISPEGRPANLGEVLLNDDGNSKLSVTSDLQAFGLIVTAEPYFAVTKPSDVVVMENVVTPDTNGTIEQIDAKYELLQRGQYTLNVSRSELQAIPLNSKVPIELFEARNAIRIAQWAGAEHYAADSLTKAKQDLQNAEALQESHGDRKSIITMAREAAQTAEDARVITVKKEEAEYQAQQAQNAAKANADAQQAQAQAAQASQEKAEAQAGQQQAHAEQQQAQAQAAQAQAQAQQAEERAAQAETEKATLRAKLLTQLNAILQTRDTQRGLVVNMTDILFQSGQYNLRPGAREALAKIAGVLLAYPGINIEIDGYTDNLGSEQLNDALSSKRAEAVEKFLEKQGVPPGSVTAHGLGDANPIAANDTATGRQLNRRVEIVLSGNVIGTIVSASAVQP